MQGSVGISNSPSIGIGSPSIGRISEQSAITVLISSLVIAPSKFKSKSANIASREAGSSGIG